MELGTGNRDGFSVAHGDVNELSSDEGVTKRRLFDKDLNGNR